MRLVLISDTHSLHSQVKLPDGDVLIHSGDFMHSGKSSREIISFCQWVKDQPHKYKIVISGNHDVFMEQEPSLGKAAFGSSVNYLNDSGVKIEGVKFWGSPVSPRFMNWSFNRARGSDIDRHWQMIPEDTNVLITHGPPSGILDECTDGRQVGCADLRKRLDHLPDLKLNTFGHIHHSYGKRVIGDITFVNASQCNERYRIANAPIVVDL